jgi:hypothetical protein
MYICILFFILARAILLKATTESSQPNFLVWFFNEPIQIESSQFVILTNHLEFDRANLS